MNVSLRDVVEKGQVIGEVRDIFGRTMHTYKTQNAGVVVGMNVNPVCQVGDRLVHLGVVGHEFMTDSQDGH